MPTCTLQKRLFTCAFKNNWLQELAFTIDIMVSKNKSQSKGNEKRFENCE